jgi:anhydro-N-acetylmuramic acid kinase
VKVLAHRGFKYAKAVRVAVLACAGGKKLSAAEMAALSWKLGAVYAACVAQTLDSVGVKAQLVACHGQTVVHDAAHGVTWQMGEAAVIAERLRLPVVSDFRPAEMAAGGQGAPLVPMLDWCVFRHATKGRVLLNLGGIANMTALPAGCGVDAVMAFDSGPGNMVIDAAMQRLYGRAFDRGGAIAAKGRVLREVVVRMMGAPFFAAHPPKSCGREEFGAAFVDALLARCGDAQPEDVVATATALTVETVAEAYRMFCWPWLGQRAPLAKATELIVAGGGAKNRTLMLGLTERFGAMGVRVATTQAAGIEVEAKEAAAFALLGWLTWHGLPGNVPSATGAERAVVLGKVTYGV